MLIYLIPTRVIQMETNSEMHVILLLVMLLITRNPFSSGLTVNGKLNPTLSNPVSLDIKNRDDVEINVQRGESVCIESEDGVWHGELCDGPYAGNVKIEVENARVIYTPSEDTSLHDDFLMICEPR